MVLQNTFGSGITFCIDFLLLQPNKGFKKFGQKPYLCHYEGNNFKVVEKNSPNKCFMCKQTCCMKLHQQFYDHVHLVLDIFNLHKEVQQVAIVVAQQQNNTKKIE